MNRCRSGGLVRWFRLCGRAGRTVAQLNGYSDVEKVLFPVKLES